MEQVGFDQFVNDLALLKHKKKSITDVAHLTKVRLLANMTNRVFGDHLRFGYFQNVKQERFSQAHSGRFVIAHGDGTFIRALNYSGQHSVADLQAFVVSSNGKAISLEPLLFWEQCPKHLSDRPHCFLFDSFPRHLELAESPHRECAGPGTETKNPDHQCFPGE